MTLASYLHTLDPFLLRLGPDFGIRWYGLSYVAAFIIGWALWRWLSARGLSAVPVERVPDAMVAVILGTLLGGRLGYALVYDPALFVEWNASFPFWGLLALNKGGMASHGGMVGLVCAAWYVSRGFKVPAGRNVGSAETVHLVGRSSLLPVMDTLALIAPPGLLLGRVANFINGELLGKIVASPGEPGPWWSIRFPQELRGWVAPGVRDPLSHTPALSPEQQVKLNQLVDQVGLPGESYGRVIERIIASAGRHAAELNQLLSSRHPSQLYQAAAEGLVLGLVLWAVAASPRRPGVVAASFFAVYGVLRVVTEFWRLPDPQFGATMRIVGLSRGQWLSVGMVAVGVGLALWAIRVRREPTPGWWRSMGGGRAPAPPLGIKP